MTDSYRSEMLKALTGELSASEREAFERALATTTRSAPNGSACKKSAAFCRKAAPTRSGRSLPPASRSASKAEREESLTDALVWLFRPLAPVAIAVVAFLALSNWNERELIGDDASFFAAIFAAVPATPEAAYVLDM